MGPVFPQLLLFFLIRYSNNKHGIGGGLFVLCGKKIQSHQFGRWSKSRAMGTSHVSHQGRKSVPARCTGPGALRWSVAQPGREGADPALDLHTGPVQPPVLGNLALLLRVWQLLLRHPGREGANIHSQFAAFPTSPFPVPLLPPPQQPCSTCLPAAEPPGVRPFLSLALGVGHS